MLTLFLGFTKRRAELSTLAGHGGQPRQVLDDFDPAAALLKDFHLHRALSGWIVAVIAQLG